jgi:hypothetical protein
MGSSMMARMQPTWVRIAARNPIPKRIALMVEPPIKVPA